MRKSYRVKSEKDFQRAFKLGDSVANRAFVIYLVITRPYARNFDMTEVRKNLLHALTLAHVIEKIPDEDEIEES